MKILITGSNGFIGRNLVWNLKEIREGRNRTRPDLLITQIFGYDLEVSEDLLDEACASADFVFHFAGVNRPKDEADFMRGNRDLAGTVLNKLKQHGNRCPVMLSSSVQATLTGRFEGSVYGQSKLAGEELFREYGRETGVKTLIYRFPNVFGKWCKPNYNSAVATFCHAIANDQPYHVNDRATELDLVYIDDLVEEMLDALEGREHRCRYEGGTPVPDPDGDYCHVPTTHHASLGEIVDLLEGFHAMPGTLILPEIPAGSLAKKLYSTYLSYLPREQMAYTFRSSVDNRGSFTELIRTARCGQISVNVAKPGITRGEHWHNSKWEIFIVVSGHGMIRQRRIGIDPETHAPWPVYEFEVTGEQIRAVQMLPGYAHSIVNLSKTEDLVTVMWANEPFDSEHPDTYYEPVILNDADQAHNPEKGNV